MRTLLGIVVSAAFMCGLGSSVASNAAELTVATWNIANLHHETGVPLRDGSAARSDIDYERLQGIGAGLGADIIALQEIGSLKAAARVFPPSEWHLYISDRYQPGDEDKPAAERDIFTGFAVRKSAYPTAPAVTTLSALSISHLAIRDGEATDRPTRAGLVMALDFDGTPVRLLNVHLKSFCHSNSLSPIYDETRAGKPQRVRYDCRTLKAQLGILENWVEQQKQLGHAVILAGDFNRRMNREFPNGAEHFWADLNDGKPEGVELAKFPEGEDAVCWTKHSGRHPEIIDFVVVDSELLEGSSVEAMKVGLGFDEAPEYQGKENQKLSDHCPSKVKIFHN